MSQFIPIEPGGVMEDTRDPWVGMHVRPVEIPIEVKLDDGIYVATSPLIKGLIVVTKDGSQIYSRVYEAMKDLTQVATAQGWTARQARTTP